MNTKHTWIIGLIAFLGIIGVGIGEWLILFNPEGGYSFTDYSFLENRPDWKINVGHYLSVVFGPAYFLAYYHIMRNLRPKKELFSSVFLGIALYTFALAGMWISSRGSLALGVNIAQQVPKDGLFYVNQVVYGIAHHADPLLKFAWLGLFLLSGIFSYLVWTNQTVYPRWIAITNPLILLISVFVFSMVFVPAIGVYIVPTAMNVTHLLFLGGALIVTRRQ